MQSASIVLALCLLAKASADQSSYGSGSGSDTTEACAAAQDEYDAAQGDTTYTCLDADGAELEVVDARSSESSRAEIWKSSRTAAQALAYSPAKSCDDM